MGLCSDVVAICSDAGEWSLQSVRLRRWRRRELQHSTSLHASLGNKAAASGACESRTGRRRLVWLGRRRRRICPCAAERGEPATGLQRAAAARRWVSGSEWRIRRWPSSHVGGGRSALQFRKGASCGSARRRVVAAAGGRPPVAVRAFCGGRPPGGRRRA